MNAHADMFIVAERNESNTPRGIYRFLVSGVRKVPVFKSPKQAPINAFLLCLQNQLIVNISINLKLHRKGTAKFVNLQILSRKSFKSSKSLHSILREHLNLRNYCKNVAYGNKSKLFLHIYIFFRTFAADFILYWYSMRKIKQRI